MNILKGEDDLKKSRLMLICIKDVVNQSTNQVWFTKGNKYIGVVEDYKLYAIDDFNSKCYISDSRSGLWYEDEWFSEHFIEDKKKSYELNKPELESQEHENQEQESQIAPEMKRVVIKYNQDDILELLTESLAEKHGFGTFTSKAVLLGVPGRDIRLVAVIGELDDDELLRINLSELDLKTEFNGSH